MVLSLTHCGFGFCELIGFSLENFFLYGSISNRFSAVIEVLGVAQRFPIGLRGGRF